MRSRIVSAILVVPAILLSSSLIPAAAGAAGVSAQGILISGDSPYLRLSPHGTFTMQIVPTKVAVDRFEAEAVVTGPDGAAHRLSGARGNPLYVTDDGRVITLETYEAVSVPSFVRVYDAGGRELASRPVAAPSDPLLSPDGSAFACRTRDGILVIDLADYHESLRPACDLFALGPGGSFAGVSWSEGRDRIRIEGGGAPARSAHPGVTPRALAFSLDGRLLYALGAGALVRVDVATGDAAPLYAAPDGLELRDLRVTPAGIELGARRIDGGRATGERIALDAGGGLVAREVGPSMAVTWGDPPTGVHGSIPWPLRPNAQHAIGNTYGEYQNYGGAPYPHPGSDVFGSALQSVYAVRGGVVKAILTTEGQWHWRIAVGDSATSGTCKGYLYAHIDHSTIAVTVGQVIVAGQYLGGLVQWPSYNFTHTHFARIQESGVTWDGAWLVPENAHLDLQNQFESEPPVFEPARGSDLLAFCTNETSSYLAPSALHGPVDIIAHVGDRIASTWVCSVQEIRYTIYPAGLPQYPIVNDKLAVSFDMPLDTYQNGVHDALLINILYKQDSVCRTQGDYDYREFYHVITNSDGDQSYGSEDLAQCWDTTNLPDRSWVIRVTAKDVVGNATSDSMTVTTVNGNPSAVASGDAAPRLVIGPSYPNPAAEGSALPLILPSADRVAVWIQDPSGRTLRTLHDGPLAAGTHVLRWDGRDASGNRVPSGVYLYRVMGTTISASAKTILAR